MFISTLEHPKGNIQSTNGTTCTEGTGWGQDPLFLWMTEVIRRKYENYPHSPFYHKAAIKTIHLKVCGHTDIRDPPAECALCHILNQHGNDKRRGFGSPNARRSWALQGHIAAAFPKAQPRRGSCSGRQRKTCPSIDFLLQSFERL